MKPSSAPQPTSILGRVMRQVTDTIAPASQSRLHEAFMGSAGDPADLKVALELLQRDPAPPVVLMDAGKGMHPDPRLALVLRYPNVRVTGVINIIELFGAFQQPREGNDGLRASAIATARSHIRHDLGHALRGDTHYDKVALLNRARLELGLTGDDDAVAAAVMAQDDLPPPAEHWDVEAAFADWDGTLKRDGAVDLPLLAKIRDRAGELPMAVWTGGDPDAVQLELRAAGVTDVHAASKLDSRGMRARLAIDDEPLDVLEKTYGISATTHVDIRTLLS